MVPYSILLYLTLATGQLAPQAPRPMEAPGALKGGPVDSAPAGTLLWQTQAEVPPPPPASNAAPANLPPPAADACPDAEKKNGDKDSNGCDKKKKKKKNGDCNGDCKSDDDKGKDKDKDKDDECKEKKEKEKKEGCFLKRFIEYNCEPFKKKDDDEDEDEEKPARWNALPEAWSSPPFPGHEFQGYPLPGVPREDERFPIMEAIYDGPCGDWIKSTNIKFYGWCTASGNFSTAKESNAPTSYWVVPNHVELDQLVFRLELEPDFAQDDHVSWGFRSTVFYGMDYRYTTAGGWGSDQLLEHNNLYGWDPLEQYVDCFIPYIIQGLDIRVGRWVACPDIETQLAPDNYLGSHSILFTYDTYTQSGVMLTQRINKNLIVQLGINCGDDMAPWYKGATPCGYAGVRYVWDSNKDAVYSVLNQCDNGEFRHFDEYGVPLGHDNYNYEVTTWEHVINKDIHTNTEAYYMWEHDAVVGGTPSAGPVEPYGSGGGIGATIPGLSRAYGVLNYTMFAIPDCNKNDFITVRNEYYRDETGFRTGFAGVYSSHTIGITHNFNKLLQFRPEIGYYRNWTQDAFDNGTKQGIMILGADVTYRF